MRRKEARAAARPVDVVRGRLDSRVRRLGGHQECTSFQGAAAYRRLLRRAVRAL